jgi:hypothetical protein
MSRLLKKVDGINKIYMPFLKEEMELIINLPEKMLACGKIGNFDFAAEFYAGSLNL